MKLIYSGVFNGLDIRVVDLGVARTPRLAIEYSPGLAALGEMIWLPFQQFDINLIVQISLAIGIIK